MLMHMPGKGDLVLFKGDETAEREWLRKKRREEMARYMPYYPTAFVEYKGFG